MFMEYLSKEAGIIYEFNRQHEPIKKVHSGTTLQIETYDCFTNQIRSEDTPVARIDWNRVNPATGPIYVEGAMPGDVLKVKIEQIELANQGVMVVGPQLGVMGQHITEMQSKIISVENGHALFDDVRIPLNPMIGVIGVAPEGDGINCGTPGSHGGNMDNKMVAEGATLYFPVFAEGALFGLGDFHAAMGDGEVSVSGIEIPGKATVTLEVIKDTTLRHPMLENVDAFTQIASAKTLDEAIRIATEEMIIRIVDKSNRSIEDVTMLMSACGQAEICQIVDPLMTARFVVPKWLLKQLNVELL